MMASADVTGVHVGLVDPSGKTVATAVSELATIPAGETHSFAMHATVWHPQLWSWRRRTFTAR